MKHTKTIPHYESDYMKDCEEYYGISMIDMYTEYKNMMAEEMKKNENSEEIPEVSNYFNGQ